MSKKKIPITEIDAFVERIQKNPDLFEKFCKILDLSDPKAQGKGLDVNSLEGFLKSEIRETGRLAIERFSQELEEESAQELQEDPQAREREKKR